MKNLILEKIAAKELTVGVIGLGYVGLPLALCFVEKGFRCIGFDIDPNKTAAIMEGRSYIGHIPAERIRKGVHGGRFTATSELSAVRSCDCILIAVPTPLTPEREPDLSFVKRTAESMVPYLRNGQLIVLESTTYPGTTTDVLVPILERSGLRCDTDFFVAYSPEREDPNNPHYSTQTIPKVIGATSPDGLEAADAVYRLIVDRTVPVSSTQVAEAAKLMENIFRSVNIALVNELKVTFMKMGIDIWEVIEAAKTKPFGFMPFYPGPGLGGHCIPIDPFYLSWRARQYGIETRFIELAGLINRAMPEFIVRRAGEVLNCFGKDVKGSRILVLGLAYKPDLDDDRESPSYVIMEQLQELGAEVQYHDPHIPVIKETRDHLPFAGKQCAPINEHYDLFILATAHSHYRTHDLTSYMVPIIDTRHVVTVPHPLVFQA